MMNHLQTVNIDSARRMIAAACRADQSILLVGAPGVGKTAIAREVARDLGLPLVTLLGSTLDATDVAGFPVVRPKSGLFERVPLAAIRQAASEPCLLFLDELSCSPPPVQAAFLRLLHDRVAGDVALHPGTRVIAACNPPDQAPGGFELSAPLVNRFAGIYAFRPGADEVRAHFELTLGAPDSGRFGALARDWAYTTQYDPALIQLDPPPASVTEGAPWASPRAWEQGLRMLAALPDHAPHADELLALSGAVGDKAAVGYLGIRRLRDQLPSVDAVAKDPEGARIPSKAADQVGALGLLAEVAQREPWAAWLYAGRLTAEVGTAAAHSLIRVDTTRAKAHAAAGRRAMTRLLANITRPRSEVAA